MLQPLMFKPYQARFGQRSSTIYDHDKRHFKRSLSKTVGATGLIAPWSYAPPPHAVQANHAEDVSDLEFRNLMDLMDSMTVHDWGVYTDAEAENETVEYLAWGRCRYNYHCQSHPYHPKQP